MQEELDHGEVGCACSYIAGIVDAVSTSSATNSVRFDTIFEFFTDLAIVVRCVGSSVDRLVTGVDCLDGAAVYKSNKFLKVSNFPMFFVRAIDSCGVCQRLSGLVEVEVRVIDAISSVRGELGDVVVRRRDNHPLFHGGQGHERQRSGDGIKVGQEYFDVRPLEIQW